MLKLPEGIIKCWFNQLNAGEPVTPSQFDQIYKNFPFIQPQLFERCQLLMRDKIYFKLFKHYVNVFDDATINSEQKMLFNILDEFETGIVSKDRFKLFLNSQGINSEEISRSTHSIFDYYKHTDEFEFADLEIIKEQINWRNEQTS
ncbi:EF-hand_domain pair [Hexamita inflata]|uniref:EF-hand domain pair n=1 Tax=Hexamita inflata TaxID=28002 RepID=A0AA86PKB8_9EUKA|nr:EF-hand domain pair [Hexamita inflata]